MVFEKLVYGSMERAAEIPKTIPLAKKRYWDARYLHKCNEVIRGEIWGPKDAAEIRNRLEGVRFRGPTTPQK